MNIKYFMILCILAGCMWLLCTSYQCRKYWNKRWYTMVTELFVDTMILSIGALLIFVIAIAGRE